MPVRDFLGTGFAMRLYEKIRCFFLGSTDVLLKDRRFVIDELFFNRRLKFRTLKRYELGMMRVGNIKYGSGATGRPLNEVSPFKYLLGDTAGYDNYCRMHRQVLHYEEMVPEKYDALIKSIENDGFDAKFVIITDFDGVVKDGQHRSCYLLYKYGEDYEVPVLKLELGRRSWFNRVMRYIYKKSVGFG